MTKNVQNQTFIEHLWLVQMLCILVHNETFFYILAPLLLYKKLPAPLISPIS